MRCVVLGVVVLLLVPTVGAVPFLQHQANAARTGVVEDPGPERMDLAFWLPLPEPPAPASVPIIIGHSIYVLTTASLWRFDVRDATMELIASLTEEAATGLASDGTALFFVAGSNLSALALDGTPAWARPVPLPGTLPPEYRWGCAPLAVVDDEVVAACAPRQDGQLNFYENPLVVVRVDRVSGEVIEEWSRGITDGTPVTGSNPDLYGEHATGVPTHVVVGADYIAVGEAAVTDLLLPSRARVWLLDRESLALRGVWVADFFVRAVEGTFRADPAFVQHESQNGVHGLAGRDDLLLVNSLDLVALDPADASVVWRQQLRTPTATDIDDPGGLALVGGDLVALIPGGLVRADAATSTPRWNVAAPVAGDAWIGTPGILVVGDLFFTATWPTPHSLAGFYAADGSPAARRATGGEVTSMGVGEGIMAVLTLSEGAFRIEPPIHDLLVFGSPPAAIGLDVSLSDLYPGLGKTVRLDLDVRDGVLAEGWRATVDWGDGTATVPAQETRFEHTYSDAIRRDITVSVTNEAGQEASWSTTIFVGEQAPNFVSNAFSPENQESTFFLLGVILTLIFAAFGVVRLRRKRGLLRHELAAADRIVGDNREDPDTMREKLREHRLRARRLFLDGRLDEGSTGILERHVDELLRDHRLSRVEADLAFLPHGLFRAMQEMLRDARVTELEKTQFLRSLSTERALSAAQKARVRRHVETWHREDAI